MKDLIYRNSEMIINLHRDMKYYMEALQYNYNILQDIGITSKEICFLFTENRLLWSKSDEYISVANAIRPIIQKQNPFADDYELTKLIRKAYESLSRKTHHHRLSPLVKNKFGRYIVFNENTNTFEWSEKTFDEVERLYSRYVENKREKKIVELIGKITSDAKELGELFGEKKNKDYFTHSNNTLRVLSYLIDYNDKIRVEIDKYL